DHLPTVRQQLLRPDRRLVYRGVGRVGFQQLLARQPLAIKVGVGGLRPVRQSGGAIKIYEIEIVEDRVAVEALPVGTKYDAAGASFFGIIEPPPVIVDDDGRGYTPAKILAHRIE